MPPVMFTGRSKSLRYIRLFRELTTLFSFIFILPQSNFLRGFFEHINVVLTGCLGLGKSQMRKCHREPYLVNTLVITVTILQSHFCQKFLHKQ